ncbi:hypothetical protein PoB_006349800 [Plakobranchus ocellatus]|uniref:Secreted protein n=1 Tax=Plakobranchus ocellatus TaxID=259542 RepID=A0AAV4CYK8_9GAST|nr:hypothetical protein PoB_006349800 [Plakobranchus ocellatus]
MKGKASEFYVYLKICFCHLFLVGGVGSTVACESALRSAGTLLSRVRALLPAPWPDGGPKSLRSPCCGLAIYKNSFPGIFTTSHIKIARAERIQKGQRAVGFKMNLASQ